MTKLKPKLPSESDWWLLESAGVRPLHVRWCGMLAPDGLHSPLWRKMADAIRRRDGRPNPLRDGGGRFFVRPFVLSGQCVAQHAKMVGPDREVAYSPVFVFRDWSAHVLIYWDQQAVSRADIQWALSEAGAAGLCEFGAGQFTATQAECPYEVEAAEAR